MSNLNLLPWRERQRQDAMRRWAWGTGWACLLAAGLAWALDSSLSSWQEQRESQQQQWALEQQALKKTLAEGPLWQARMRQAQQIKADAVLWQLQQQQAWRILRRVLSLPPNGVQIALLDWQDKQLQIQGWAVSAAHLQRWQDALQAQRVEFQAPQWRQADGVALRQHAFELKLQSSVAGVGS